MSDYETTYQVITPSGVFEAVWGEDPMPIEYRGNEAAILHFKNFLALDSVSGFHGILLNADTLQPDELYLFCQPTGRGIIVMPALDDLLDYERDELNQHYSNTVLDSVEDSNVQVSGIEKLKLVKELSGIRGDMSGSVSGIAKLKLVKRLGEIRVLLGIHAANEEPNNTDLEPDGKDNEVKTAKGTKIVTGFMVIEASKLIVSHDEQGNANPDYPKEMQPRDRARDTSQAQIARIAKNLDPDMLGRTRVAYQGAPIIGKDGVVESGNGRAMAITLAYKLGKADEYRAWLLDIADMYGLNPDKIEHMKRPVLVRVRKTDVDRAQFAIEANQSDMLAMTATEKAKSDAARLTDAIISKLSIEGDLTAASNRDFIMAFLQSLGDDETAGLLTTMGQPTKQLYDRAQAAVFAKAYNDDRLLELMADAEKPEIANIIKSLNQAAQPFITARNISEHATHATTQKIGDAIDVSLDQQAVDAIIKATEMLKKAKDSGMPIEELIKQNDLFGDIDPVVAQMALFIKDNNRSPARMGAAFVAMAEFVVKELESRQNASLFDDDMAVDMVDVLKAANAQLQKQYGEDVKAIGGTGGFIDMFTETRGQKEDREAFLAGKDSPIELTGKELGDFPDTEEGKKDRREATKDYLENKLRGQWILCKAINKEIEIRQQGIDESIYWSANPKKLKALAVIDRIIKGAHSPDYQSNFKVNEKPHVIEYIHLKNTVTIDGEPTPFDVIIERDADGLLHYDIMIPKAKVTAALDSSSTAAEWQTTPDTKSGIYHKLSVRQGDEKINIDHIFDTASSDQWVLNLFIEGEDSEVAESDELEANEENEPSNTPDRFSPHDIVFMSDITDEKKRIPVNFRGYIDNEKSMVVYNGSQMTIDTDRLFKDDLPAIAEPILDKNNIVMNEGSGIEINNLYKQWEAIKTAIDHSEWEKAVINTKFGTYGTTSFLEVLNNFEPKFKSIFLREQFTNEVKAALNRPITTPEPEIVTPEVVEPTPTITGNTEIDGYKSKLLGLQQLQDRMKAANKIIKSKHSDEQKTEALKALGYSDHEAYVLLKPDFAGRMGYTYQLTNNNANIASTKKRITQLEAQDLASSKANSGDSQTSYDFDGGTIELDYSADRLKVDFDAIPDSDMNSKLKRNGFKWSPTNRVWQRQLTDNAISTANYLFNTKIKTAATMMTEEENKPRPNPIIQAIEPVIEPITPIEPVQNETAEIDAEITEPSNNAQTEKISAYSDELDSIRQETNSIELMRRLNDIVARIEADNLMDEMDVNLNQASDAVDELFKEAQKNAV